MTTLDSSAAAFLGAEFDSGFSAWGIHTMNQ